MVNTRFQFGLLPLLFLFCLIILFGAIAVPYKAGAEEGPGIVIVRIPAPILMDPGAPEWQSAPAHPVSLSPQERARPTGGSRKALTVKALHDGQKVYFLLEWQDKTKDSAMVGSEQFRDAAAIQFPLNPSRLPFYAMGQPTGLVNIWHWKADWEQDLAAFTDMEDRFPGMVWDYYPLSKGIKAADQYPAYITGLAAENLFSNPKRTSSVEELNAEGFGTLTPQPAPFQSVTGKGTWEKGRWRVVMARTLVTGDSVEGRPVDVPLAPGTSTYAAFAVWDGSKGERNGIKSISVWTRIVIQ